MKFRRMLAPLIAAFGMAAFYASPPAQAAENGIAELVENLCIGNYYHQREAADALVKIGPAKTIPALMAGLQNGQCEGSSFAYVLESFGSASKNAVAPLLEMLASSDPKVRRGAAFLLGHEGAGGAEAVPLLIGMIQDSEPRTALRSIEALGNIGPAAKVAVPALTNALAKDNWQTREYVIRSLGKIGAQSSPAIPELLRLSRESKQGSRDIYLIEPALISIHTDEAEKALTSIENENFKKVIAREDYYGGSWELNSDLQILAGWKGRTSQIASKSHYAIRSAPDWEKLWQKHRGGFGSAPKIDFSTQMIVAIFMGTTGNTEFLRIEDIAESAKAISITFYYLESDSYGEGSNQFIMLMLPKSAKPIKLISKQDVAMSANPKTRCAIESLFDVGASTNAVKTSLQETACRDRRSLGSSRCGDFDYRLDGLISSAPQSRAAIINSVVYNQGSKVGQARITDITETSITLKCDHHGDYRLFTLKLSR